MDESIEPILPHGSGSRVNYRLPIFKHGRRNIASISRGNLAERYGVPYPSVHENIHLKGLLIDSKVYLYDLAEYNFLRFSRGYFGEVNYVTPYEADQPKLRNDYRSDLDFFPPSSHIFPVASLNLLEAYFLNFICGSLDIWDGCSQRKLLRQDLMGIFSQLDDLFPYFFAAYVHFRQKKYTVKSGIKFGTDFVLYEYGPSRTHSLYSAHVIIPGLRDPGLAALDAMQRACNTVKKDVLLVQVTAPADFSKEDFLGPDSFVKMDIKEVIVRRRETLTEQKDASSELHEESTRQDVQTTCAQRDQRPGRLNSRKLGRSRGGALRGHGRRFNGSSK